ncbi:filamentous hemagglutinin [Atopomonas hussainii]|uniref:Filamentous hemagglutinin n=1 Tax=Atopomonas hussainii TaxID=1429083 RepID=A0A1H7JE60_9GAMM|nr:DUF637 domain-containing protein [Atopomonas hussainii]SEK72732.1 filamentous hemagglutinin [Atopomonas hussainii]
MDAYSPINRAIARLLIVVMTFDPLVSAAAEITVDNSAGGNTALGNASNGVPLVNIATPNGNGLSHNRFGEFNVGSQGLILNNATDKLQSTQLGGYVLGNPNLKGSAASLILNEVNGGNPSQLKGYTEVAGKSAAVVIANPHGIACDGCGFINTPRVTLSTGKPQIEAGRLTGYDVDGGSIAVQGAGLNASNVSQFDLITRSAEINADIHAQQLNIIAGRNQVDANSLQATQKASDGNAPALAIDSSALGGMYAGAIRLVGTEAGVGVKLAGDMAASAGDLIISSNGQLTVGKAQAQGNATLQAQDIELTDNLHANGNLRAEAANEINNEQTLSARGDLTLVGKDVYNNGAIEAGIDAEGESNTASVLRVEGDYLGNDGRITAQGQLQIATGELGNKQGEIVSGQHGQITTGELNNQNGKLLGQSSLTVTTQTLDNRAGTIASNQALNVTASDTLNNQNDGLILAKQGDVTINAATLNNQGGVVQVNQGALNVSGGQTNNQGGKLLAGQGNLSVTQSAGLNNNAGLISALGGSATITVATGDVSNVAGRMQAKQLTASSANKVDNTGGQIVASEGALNVSATDELVNNSGLLQSDSQVTLNAARLTNYSGQIGAPLVNITASDSLDNYLGLIEAAERLSINTGWLNNDYGKLRALGETGTSTLSFTQLNNQNGLIEIGNARLALSGDSISNSGGTVRHVGDEAFDFNWAAVGLAGGSFITNADLSYNAAEWTNESYLQANSFDLTLGHFMQTGGRLVSAGDMFLRGGAIDNDGLLASDGELHMTLSGQYRGFGELQSVADMHIDVAAFEQGEAARARTAGNAHLKVAGLFDSTGSFTSQGDFSLQAGQVQLQYATLGSDQQLRVTANKVDNQGLLFSGTDMTLYVSELHNTGNLYSFGDLTLAANEGLARSALLENLSGTIESVGDMRLHVEQLRNDRARYRSEQRLLSGHISVWCYDCSGDHHNVDYIANETSQTHVQEDSGAALIHSGNLLQIAAGVINNVKSTISATGNIAISADNLNNHGEAIEHVVRTRTFNTGRITDGTDGRFRSRVLVPYNNAPLPKTMPGDLYAWTLTGDIETRTMVNPGAAAIIQAGGNVSIQATQSIDSDSVRSLQAAQGKGAQSADTSVDGQSQPLVVRLSSQAGPDTQQQAVDPLGLPSFSLPQGKGGLFRVITQPGHRYLVETDPQFASLKNFLNSDYMLSRLGYAPDAMQKRLGDGLYEQRLIRDAITARTGQRFIAGLNTDEAMFRYLMDNAIASKSALNLAVGVALSAEQVAALTHDIVWMEEREVMGQKVLVPVLYLAQASGRLAPSGSLIQGQEVTLISGGALNNRGTLKATKNLTAQANNIHNSGLVEANERLSLLAVDSIRNSQGGIIKGQEVNLTAVTGDIRNERTISQQQLNGRNFSQTTSVVDSAARIESSGDMSLSAGRNIEIIGGALNAGGDLNLQGGQDVIIAAAQEEQSMMRKDKRHFWSRGSVTQHGAELVSGGDMNIDAGNDVQIVASKALSGGDIKVAADNNVVIAAAANESHSEYRYKRSKKKINKENSQITQQASELQAGGDISVIAGQDIGLIASRAEAANEAYFYAGGDLALLAAQDSSYSLYDMKKKGSWGSKKSQRDEVTKVTNVGSQIITGGDLTLVSEGDQTYQAARLESGNDLTLQSGGAITFEGVKDLEQESHEKSKSSWAWNSMKGKGNTDETLRQSQLVAKGDIVIQAVEGLQIDIKEVNQQTVSQTINAMVSADPDLAWLKDMEQRGDVDWRRVKEIHDSYKYSHSGLGGPAMMIIAIIVTYLTWGAGSGLVGAAQGTWQAAAANTVASAAASNAATSTINNRGNLGAVIKDVTSEDALRGYVVSGVTAGLTAGVFDGLLKTNTDPFTKQVTVDLSSLEGVGRFAGNQLLQSGTSTLLDRALGGNSSISDALRSSLANTFAAVGFNWVGDQTAVGKWDLKDGSLGKIGLHAVMGGLAAEAAGGDFKTGALAAGINEALVGALSAQYDKLGVEDKAALLTMNSQVIGVLTAAAQGGDEKALQTGSWVASSATQYNHDLHSNNAKSFAAGVIDACRQALEGCSIDPSSVDSEDVIRVLEVMAAHGEGAGTLNPEAIKLVNQFYLNEAFHSTLERDLFSLTDSEQARLDVEFKAELALAALSLGREAIKSGPSLYGWLKGGKAKATAVPKGFSGADDFAHFGADVRDGLKQAGYGNVEPILQGSAVTGKSFKTGEAFDAGRVSDFDIALAGSELLLRAKSLGVGLRSGGTRTGPLSARDLQALGLKDLASQLSARAGREVNFMIYDSAATAAGRAPSVVLPK